MEISGALKLIDARICEPSMQQTRITDQSALHQRPWID